MLLHDDSAHTQADMRTMRRELRDARSAFVGAIAPAVRHALESALADWLLPHLGKPGTIGTYAATGDEIDPASAQSAASAAGWRIAFPRVVGPAPLCFHHCSFAELAPGFKGIPEPPATAPTVVPDVLLVPLLAADRAGNRLGQGAGHYDRTLASLRAAGPVLAIGFAWDMQIVERIESQPWDQPLDAIATPAAFHLAGPGARRNA